MKKVFKYTLSVTGDAQSIFLDPGAEILGIKVQNNVPILYALVNANIDTKEMVVKGYTTGEPVHDGKYIGTAMLDNETFVLHFFKD